MKRLGSILMISCFMVALAHGEPTLDKHSGIPLPETMGKFKRTKVIDNELEYPGLGTTVFYNTPGLKATLYIYNMGRTLQTGLTHNLLRTVLRSPRMT